jgi:uncharacterized protein (DUF736 family)
MESQWNRERENKINSIHLEGRAYDVKATIKNNIFPEPREIYNCTTCKEAEPEHPAYKVNTEKFRVKCTWNKHWNEGPRYEDIACPKWERRWVLKI